MRSLWLITLVLVVACGLVPGAPTTTTTAGTPSTTPPTATTLAGTATTSATDGCPADLAFVDRGRVVRLDQPASDTSSVGLISWQVDAGCERYGIDFETTEGAPATTPPSVIVDFLESRQVLRVWMGVESTVITDQLVESPLVARLFVVRALGGGMFIDLHLIGPAQARVAITNSPARMSLELQSATDPFSAAPAVITDQVVVVSPNVGIEIGTEVEVSGYARTFESNVLMIATVDDEVVAETNVTAADSVETWGEFRAPLVLPVGQVSLFVGEESPEDGALTGATLNLMVR